MREILLDLALAVIAWPWLDRTSQILTLNAIIQLGEPLEAATAVGYQGA